MKSYEATVTIARPPEAVWTVLADAAAWPSWNSGVTAVDGRIANGDKLTIRTEVSPARAFPVRVTDLEAPRRMVFSGSMPLGLFRGCARTPSRKPTAAPPPSGCVRSAAGRLLSMIWKSMPDLQPSFDRFAAGLKQRVESGA